MTRPIHRSTTTRISPLASEIMKNHEIISCIKYIDCTGCTKPYSLKLCVLNACINIVAQQLQDFERNKALNPRMCAFRPESDEGEEGRPLSDGGDFMNIC